MPESGAPSVPCRRKTYSNNGGRLAEMAFATEGRKVTARQFTLGPVPAGELIGVADASRLHGFVHEGRVYMFAVTAARDDDAVYARAIKVMERLELASPDTQP